MKEINISINMDANQNIFIKNLDSGKDICIESSEKKLKGSDVWAILNYDSGNTYCLSNEYDGSKDDDNTNYYFDLYYMFKDMLEDINKLNEENKFNAIDLKDQLEKQNEETIDGEISEQDK